MSDGKGQSYSNEVVPADSEWRLALCMTTAPTATSTATGLTVGGGYTAGGPVITITSVSAGIATGPSSVITLSNSSGVPWVITGAVVHDAGAAHPNASNIKYFSDLLAISVPDSGELVIPIDGLVFTEV